MHSEGDTLQVHIIFAVIGVVAALASIFSVVMLRVTLTRRLKIKLKPNGGYWETGALDFGFLNTYLFAWACTIPAFQRLEKFQSIYPGLDVRAYARWFERWMAYMVIGGLLVFFISGAIAILLEP